jgi:membrane-bound lytic murein transglycosylase A
MKLSLALILLALPASARNMASSTTEIFVTATVEVNPQAIEFKDDLDFELLDTAIQRQIDAYDSVIQLNGKVKFGERVHSMGVLRDSLVLFQEIARKAQECLGKRSRKACKRDFNAAVRTRFRVFRPRVGDTRFTAYYSPDFEGSLTRGGRFQMPIHRAPEDPVLKESTREDILYRGAFENMNLESAWLDADAFELYSLQIEGGGRIHLVDADGKRSLKYISYAGKNSKPLRFFSTLMKQHGWLTTDLSYDTQHRYFLEHPEIHRILAAECPSYVYFKLTDEEPVGIDHVPLTEKRSLAYDPAFYPASGILNFIKIKIDGKTLTRFMLGQDIGGAIKGSARADLYFGFGEEARHAADTLGARGQQYFLIKREVKPRQRRSHLNVF